MTGGKVTLRLVSTGEVVEYAGELDSEGRESTIRASVDAKDGRVEVSATGGHAPPEWLVAFVRATLRSAWRATSTGVAWPRRVSRWRARSGDDER